MFEKGGEPRRKCERVECHLFQFFFVLLQISFGINDILLGSFSHFMFSQYDEMTLLSVEYIIIILVSRF